MCILCVVFFKQKTAYEMRISDWSSDVCSSDLPVAFALALFISILTYRRRTGDPGNAGLFKCFPGGRLMRFKTANGIAFRNNPSSRLARRDQQYPGGAVRFDAVRKGGDLFDDILLGVRCGRYGYLAGR